MNLYLVLRLGQIGYESYESMVVAAESEEAARLIFPMPILSVGAKCTCGTGPRSPEPNFETDTWEFADPECHCQQTKHVWVPPSMLSTLQVRLIGTAIDPSYTGVIHTSYLSS